MENRKGNDIFFPTRDNSGEFYITIKDLIEITKKANIQNPEILAKMDYWSKIIDDPDYKKDIALKDDRTTLRAVLTKRKFLLPTYDVEISVQAIPTNITSQALAAGAAPAQWELVVKSIGDRVVYLSSYALQTTENPNDLHLLRHAAIPIDGFKIPFAPSIPPESFNLGLRNLRTSRDISIVRFTVGLSLIVADNLR